MCCAGFTLSGDLRVSPGSELSQGWGGGTETEKLCVDSTDVEDSPGRGPVGMRMPVDVVGAAHGEGLEERRRGDLYVLLPFPPPGSVCGRDHSGLNFTSPVGSAQGLAHCRCPENICQMRQVGRVHFRPAVPF